MRRRKPTVYFVLMIISAIIFLGVNRFVAPQHLPWRSIDLDAPIGLATDTQLLRLSLSPSETCRQAVMAAQTFDTVPADPHRPQEPCGWDKARIVYGNDWGTLLPGESTMQCPLAAGTHIWIRSIDEAAQERFGSPLAHIHHMGSYSCRRQVGNGSGRWSEHAFANAWDIASFELEDGQIISVKTHWNGDDKERRQFLRQVRDRACQIFRVTLSPDYNAAHHDHLHIDMGPYSTCR